MGRFFCRLEKCLRRAHPPAITGVYIVVAEPFGGIAVEVLQHRESRILGGGKESFADFELGFCWSNCKRSIAAVPSTVPPRVAFGLLEKVQNVRAGPALAPHLPPLIVIAGVPARVDHPINAARPTKDSSLQIGQRAISHRRDRLGNEVPIVLGVCSHREAEARQFEQQARATSAGLNQADPAGRILGKSRGDNGPRCARTNDNIVETVLFN